MSAKVALVDTRPETVLADTRRAMELAGYREHLMPPRPVRLLVESHGRRPTPGGCTPPWQVVGVRQALMAVGYAPEELPVEPAGEGRPDAATVLLPAVKTAGAALLVAAGPPPLTAARIADRLALLREGSATIFAVADGTVCGAGGGLRRIRPVAGNVLLAGADPVAVDAVAARLCGADPLAVPHLRLCHERGLGTADLAEIEVVGDAAAARVRLDLGPARADRGPAIVDEIWYQLVGRRHARRFAATPWGALWRDHDGKGHA